MSRSILAVSALTAVLAGCRTVNDVLNDYERELRGGDYEGRISEIRERIDAGGVDELMWRLHLGGSLYLHGDRPGAIGSFDSAEDIFAKNDGTSVFKQGAEGAFAMMTNDRAFPYAGGGQDRIFTCLYKAVDYAADGNVDAARSELNRASFHQDNWLYERRKEIDEAREKLREDAESYAKENANGAKPADTSKSAGAAEAAMGNADFAAQINAGCGFDASRDGDLEKLSRKDYLNLYAAYATGVFRYLAGDEAEGYFKEVSEILPGSSMVRDDFAAVTAGTRPKDQVWVFVEDGLCPRREEWRIDLPFVLIPYANEYILYAGMAFPKLRYREAACADYTVEASGTTAALETLQDMDALLKTEFDVYFRGALAREITRTVVKVGVQVGLGVAAATTNSGDAKLAFRLAQVAAAGWAASVTQADLRSWTGLPKKVFALRVPRPADGRLVIRGGGQPVAEIALPAGNSMVFVRKPGTSAPAVVKTVSFR